MKIYSFIIMTLLLNLFVQADEKKAAVQTYEGTLKTGIMAIGGETTGTTLTDAKGTVYEVDFSKKAELAKLADTLNDKAVIITGELENRAGVEVKERHIIVAATLKAK